MKRNSLNTETKRTNLSRIGCDRSIINFITRKKATNKKSTAKKMQLNQIAAKKTASTARESTIKINSDSSLNGLRFRPLIAIENRHMHFKLKS